MKKTNRKLIPSVAMLLVSAIMLSTSSFAWFTINKSVTATGLQIEAETTANLLIKLGHESNIANMKDSHVVMTASGKVAPADILEEPDGSLVVRKASTYKEASEPDFEHAGTANTWENISDAITIANDTFTNWQDYVVGQALTVAQKTASEGETSTNVKANVTFTFAQDKGLNAAIRCGFLVGNVWTECADLNTTKGTVTAEFNDLLTLSDNGPTVLNFFVWYEGEDTDCTGAKALDLSGSNTVDIVFSVQE